MNRQRRQLLVKDEDGFAGVIVPLAPVGWWEFAGDSATISDLSGNGAHLSAEGTYFTGETSPLGANSAYRTDALTTRFTADSGDIGHIHSLTDQTWLALIRRDGDAENSQSYVMSIDGSTARAFRANNIDGKVNKWFMKPDDGLLNSTIPLLDDTSVWHLMIGRFRAEGGTDYVQGSIFNGGAFNHGTLETQASSSLTDISGEPLYLMNNGAQSSTWNGAIAVALIFDRWLSDAELESIGQALGV